MSRVTDRTRTARIDLNVVAHILVIHASTARDYIFRLVVDVVVHGEVVFHELFHILDVDEVAFETGNPRNSFEVARDTHRFVRE